MLLDTHLLQLRGRNLRYVLTLSLFDRGERSVAELVRLLDADGWVVAGRPSKAVSDALRWEIGRGRVVRLGRGRYGPGTMPRQTHAWIRARVRSLRVAPPVGSPSSPTLQRQSPPPVRTVGTRPPEAA